MRAFFLTLLTAAALWAAPYKAVYDLSSSDMRYMLNRVALIEKSASMIREAGETPEFVLTIHSGATPILAKLPDMIADEADVPVVYAIQEKLKTLIERYGVKVLGCDLAIAAYGLESEDVAPFITRTPNSILDLIRLQNNGYGAVFFVR